MIIFFSVTIQAIGTKLRRKKKSICTLEGFYAGLFSLVSHGQQEKECAKTWYLIKQCTFLTRFVCFSAYGFL